MADDSTNPDRFKVSTQNVSPPTTTSPTGIRLYDWQKKALELALKKPKFLIQAGTGSGKTLVAILAIKEFLKNPSNRIIIVVPKTVLLEKVWHKELNTAGIPPNHIGMYYGRIKEHSRILITTTASLTRIPPGLYTHLVIDEAHNILTNRLLTFIKDYNNVLCLTATLESYNYYHWKLLSFIDHQVLNYTSEQAVKEGVLVSLECKNVPIEITNPTTREEYEELTAQIGRLYHAQKAGIGNGTRAQAFGLNAKRKYLLSTLPEKTDAIKKIINDNPTKKIIIFGENNKAANKLYWELIDTSIPSIYNSSLNPKDRERNLNDYQTGRTRIMIATRSLDEGYNLPNIDIAIIISGTNTNRQTIQRVGRILRRSPNKKNAVLYQVYAKDTIEQKQVEKRAPILARIAQQKT